jgi:hypothetical protein
MEGYEFSWLRVQGTGLNPSINFHKRNRGPKAPETADIEKRPSGRTPAKRAVSDQPFRTGRLCRP